MFVLNVLEIDTGEEYVFDGEFATVEDASAASTYIKSVLTPNSVDITVATAEPELI